MITLNNRGISPLIAAGIMFLMGGAAHADWSTFQHDNARSGATTESLPHELAPSWHYESSVRPRPAWDEPAIWDGWSKTHNLTNRQVFDKAFHVAVAADRVYFGSSVDDQVHCLNANTGATQWTYSTEGPVRLAPSVAGDRLYFGSDDGFVYCVDAVNGTLIWKHRPGPTDRRLAGNGRVISHWPIRTGVVVVGDRAYCGAGVIPSDGVYVCAMSADTGDEIWKTEMKDLPAQGYLLASQSRVYVVTSRDRPLVFDAKDGKRLHQVKGGTGGTYALLTGDTLFYGPNKTGDVNMVGPGKADVLASFAGNHMIVAKPLSYLHSGDQLSGLDRENYVKLYTERKSADAERGRLDKELAKAKEAAKQAEEKKDDTNEADEKVETLTKQVADANKRLKELNQQIKACLKWTVECDCPLSLILAGDSLIAGGDGQVSVYDATNGKKRWTHPLPGKAFGLAVDHGQLFVSTDAGTIHCFSEPSRQSSTSDVAAKATSEAVPAPVRLQAYQGPFVTKEIPPSEIRGPIAEFVSPGVARITWQTSEPMTSKLVFGVDPNNGARVFDDATLKTEHEVLVDRVYRDVMYQYLVGGQTQAGRDIATEAYRFDAHFDYLPVHVDTMPSPYPDDEANKRYADVAKSMLEESGVRRGYAIVLGSTEGQLAYHLARLSDLQIVIIESELDAVQRCRHQLSQANLLGTRVSVHHRDSLDHLPYGPFLANLITSDRMLTSGRLPTQLKHLYPCLRPLGGTLVFGSFEAKKTATWKQQTVATRSELDSETDTTSKLHETVLTWERRNWQGGDFFVHRRARLAGTGEWTHQYAGPDNASCSQDDIVSGSLTAQWWGKPGARPMPDRGNRNPPPVSSQGRLYVQGNRTLFGLDAYNGTVLWAKQIPNMRRANMPRDGSNMVAQDDLLWVSISGQCLAFDGQTGDPVQHRDVPVPDELANADYDWGYIARVDEDLIGSGVRRGAHYRGDAGEWFEGAEDKDVARVTSDFLFATAWYGGAPRWTYSNGVILNSTITIADEVAYFIESRNDAAKSAKSGRLLDEILADQVLVALDMRTGQVKWEKPYDFSKCHHVTYMTHGNGTLLVAGTDPERTFYVYAFDTEDGDELWQHSAPDKKGHHTGQLAHPTIVGDNVYFNKHAYELRTGKVLYVHEFNWHGCGVMSASTNTIFSRYEYHGMYDLATKKRTELLGIRSGCWLSLIPSGGLLLAPETSAGCSCGHSLQTSIAYVPVHLLATPPDHPTNQSSGE